MVFPQLQTQMQQLLKSWFLDSCFFNICLVSIIGLKYTLYEISITISLSLYFFLLSDLHVSVTFEGVSKCVDAQYGPFSCYR